MSLRGDARRIGRGLATLRPYARGEWSALALGAVLSGVAVAFHLVRPWPLKWMLDAVTSTRTHSGVARWVHDAGTTGMLTMTAAYVLLTLAFAYATYWQVMLLNGAGNHVLFRFRTALFAHLLKQPLAFHESRDVGELLTRVVFDTSRLRRGLNGLIVSMAQTVFLFVGTLIMLFWLSPALASVLGVGAIVAVYTMHRRGRRIVRAAKKQRKKEGSVAALVADELHAVRELQTFGSGASPAQARFARSNTQSLSGEQKVRRLAAGISLRIEMLFAITIALTIVIATRATGGGFFTAGDLILFLSYALALRGPFDEFAKQTARIGRTAASASRLVKLMAREPKLVDAPTAVVAPSLRGDIAFEGVSARAPKRARGSRKWSLDDVWAAIPSGMRVAVVGGNGAGKSTLLRLALRLGDPDGGRVLVDGRDVRDYAVASLRAQYSVVFQESVLFGLSVRDNISLGSPSASDDAVARAVRRAEAHELIDRLPNKYETVVRRRGGLFSPGERQRLAIARALLRDGRVWLLDEPTTALDQATSACLVEALLSATAGRTTLWVTHDRSLIPRLDFVLGLDAGRLAFAGPTLEYAEWRRSRAAEVL